MACLCWVILILYGPIDYLWGKGTDQILFCPLCMHTNFLLYFKALLYFRSLWLWLRVRLVCDNIISRQKWIRWWKWWLNFNFPRVHKKIWEKRRENGVSLSLSGLISEIHRCSRSLRFLSAKQLSDCDIVSVISNRCFFMLYRLAVS